MFILRHIHTDVSCVIFCDVHSSQTLCDVDGFRPTMSTCMLKTSLTVYQFQICLLLLMCTDVFVYTLYQGVYKFN